ncbi:MAG: hypothetical protein R3272_13855 [Candidatus Promineifilaceae bacterium]|nr:hypothetical protein [Candidatus Promineifilaceae bacterium]
MAWRVSGKTDLPLADDDREWDGDEAEDKIFEWAGWPDDEDPDKAKQGFFAYKDDEAKEKESYKLPFATLIDGELTAVPNALHAVAAVLEGARGGVDLPNSVIDDVRNKVKKYYEKMGEEVPW